MNETLLKVQEQDKPTQDPVATRDSGTRPEWETPRMEDVSEQVTAQPYIRFT